MRQTIEKLNTNDLVLRISDLYQVNSSDQTRDQVGTIMTPERILECNYFLPPERIDPKRFPSFDALLEERDLIRTLGLLPVKSAQMYQVYKSQRVETLVKQVEEFLGQEKLAFATNGYPHLLPEDVRQFMVWVGSSDVTGMEIVDFCAKVMANFGLTTDDVILFERPQRVQARILRGSFPQKRHIHFWMRNRKERS